MKGSSLTAGLKNKAPEPVDASMKPPNGSVNTDTTRSSTALTPRTLGPREA
jgi:hypothetical protein